eukprot:COSAG02_NODE_15652_length_1151_cov_1.375475_2_plen_79_part_00
MGALAPRIAWELGGRVGAEKKLLECEEEDSTLCLPANDYDVLSPQSTLGTLAACKERGRSPMQDRLCSVLGRALPWTR